MKTSAKGKETQPDLRPLTPGFDWFARRHGGARVGEIEAGG